MGTWNCGQKFQNMLPPTTREEPVLYCPRSAPHLSLDSSTQSMQRLNKFKDGSLIADGPQDKGRLYILQMETSGRNVDNRSRTVPHEESTNDTHTTS